MLDMMSVQILFTTAFLAGVAVAFIYSNAPFSNVTACAGAFSYKRHAAFPVWGFISNKILSTPEKRASQRAKPFLLAFVCGEVFTAILALCGSFWVSFLPARLTAIFRGFKLVSLDFVFRAANSTRFYLLSVFHVTYYNIFSEKYAAVILERFFTATGITPELMEE